MSMSMSMSMVLESMVLDVRDVRGFEDEINRMCPVEEFPSETADEYTIVSDVALTLRVKKDGDNYRVVGSVRAALRLACCRCLNLFESERDIQVDLMYLPQSSNQDEHESEISGEELLTSFYRDQKINLAEMVREQLQLSLPMKPLCCNDCRGLCSTCGTNLNIENCTCDTRWLDPRLSALAALLPGRERK
jgi:uncharacterized protein